MGCQCRRERAGMSSRSTIGVRGERYVQVAIIAPWQEGRPYHTPVCDLCEVYPRFSAIITGKGIVRQGAARGCALFLSSSARIGVGHWPPAQTQASRTRSYKSHRAREVSITALCAPALFSAPPHVPMALRRASPWATYCPLSEVVQEAKTRSGPAPRCKSGKRAAPHTYGWTML
jgi:hypothetical protein